VLDRFSEKVAIVTGAAGGIGAAIARRLADEGAQVVLADFDEARLEQAVREMDDTAGSVTSHRVDVTDENQVNELVDTAAERFGGLDVLVNNAGITRDNLLFQMTSEEWDSVLDVNLKSVFLCARAAQRVMVEAKSGKIVSLSSRSALGNRGQSNYAASKAGIQGLTATIAQELGPFGINANAVAPGFVATDMTDETARRLGKDPKEFREGAAKLIPLRRVATPEDIAGVVSFLASNDARHITGQTLFVTGGQR